MILIVPSLFIYAAVIMILGVTSIPHIIGGALAVIGIQFLLQIIFE